MDVPASGFLLDRITQIFFKQTFGLGLFKEINPTKSQLQTISYFNGLHIFIKLFELFINRSVARLFIATASLQISNVYSCVRQI